MKYGFGVDLGGTTVKIAFFDTEGNMLDKWEIPTNTEDGGKKVLPDIANSTMSYLAEKGISKDNPSPKPRLILKMGDSKDKHHSTHILLHPIPKCVK